MPLQLVVLVRLHHLLDFPTSTLTLGLHYIPKSSKIWKIISKRTNVSALGMNFLVCFCIVPIVINADPKYLTADTTDHDVS